MYFVQEISHGGFLQFLLLTAEFVQLLFRHFHHEFALIIIPRQTLEMGFAQEDVTGTIEAREILVTAYDFIGILILLTVVVELRIRFG